MHSTPAHPDPLDQKYAFIDSLSAEEWEAIDRPLDNPRHEAFALALASGATPADAYDAAGFSPNNRKTRSAALARQPDISARVEAIDKAMPEIRDEYLVHARPFTTLPESPERMAVWLWQVMSGARSLQPSQMQAVKLFIRLHRWDHKDFRWSPPIEVSPRARPSLSLLSTVQVARETQFRSAPLVPEPEPETEPEPNAAPGLESAPHPGIAETSSDETHRPSALPATTPMGIDGDANPHPQTPEPQSSAAKNPQNGPKNKKLPIPLGANSRRILHPSAPSRPRGHAAKPRIPS